jgi:hypothetical protein
VDAKHLPSASISARDHDGVTTQANGRLPVRKPLRSETLPAAVAAFEGAAERRIDDGWLPIAAFCNILAQARWAPLPMGAGSHMKDTSLITPQKDAGYESAPYLLLTFHRPFDDHRKPKCRRDPTNYPYQGWPN